MYTCYLYVLDWGSLQKAAWTQPIFKLHIIIMTRSIIWKFQNSWPYPPRLGKENSRFQNNSGIYTDIEKREENPLKFPRQISRLGHSGIDRSWAACSPLWRIYTSCCEGQGVRLGKGHRAEQQEASRQNQKTHRAPATAAVSPAWTGRGPRPFWPQQAWPAAEERRATRVTEETRDAWVFSTPKSLMWERAHISYSSFKRH